MTNGQSVVPPPPELPPAFGGGGGGGGGGGSGGGVEPSETVMSHVNVAELSAESDIVRAETKWPADVGVPPIVPVS